MSAPEITSHAIEVEVALLDVSEAITETLTTPTLNLNHGWLGNTAAVVTFVLVSLHLI